MKVSVTLLTLASAIISIQTVAAIATIEANTFNATQAPTTTAATNTTDPTTTNTTTSLALTNATTIDPNTTTATTNVALTTSAALTNTTNSTAVVSTTNSITTCVAGSAGNKRGDGYKGYCCTSHDDCWKSCRNGVCNGPVAPSLTSSTKKTAKSNTQPIATCVAGSAGKKIGNGYKGYCCTSHDDCWKSCKKGVCNGPAAPSLTSTTTNSTTKPDTASIKTTAKPIDTSTKPTTKPMATCVTGSAGKKRGNGYKGYCCTSHDDCRESCKKGICNGPAAPSLTSSTKKTTISNTITAEPITSSTTTDKPIISNTTINTTTAKPTAINSATAESTTISFSTTNSVTVNTSSAIIVSVSN